MNRCKSIALPSQAALNKAVFVSLLTLAVYMLMISDLLAGTSNTPMGDVLCDVVDFVIYGNLGRGLATLAIIIVGVGAMLGKVSWGLAITVGVGISVIFGAYDIGNKLGIPAVC